MEVITGALTCPHDQTTGTARHFIEDERPSHHEGVVRTPAEYEVALRFERQERETVRDSRKRREDHTARQMLKFWDDAFLTSLSAVIKDVVAVPTRATACAHLRQPRPDVARGSVDGDGMGQRYERLGNEIVASVLHLRSSRRREQPLPGIAKHADSAAARETDISKCEGRGMNRKSYLRASARWLAAGVGVTAAAYGAYVGTTWYRYGDAAPPSPEEQDPLLDRFMPSYDVR